MSKLIPLTKGRFATVDDEDYNFLMQWKWYYCSGYAMRWVGPREKRTAIIMHRIITNAPADMQVDHRDRNRLNNTRANLRIATQKQNRANVGKTRTRRKARKLLTSPIYKGVYRVARGRWEARISTDKGSPSLGIYNSEIEAAHAYNKAAIERYGEFACLNDIPTEPVNA